ncbi:class I adenylate-forming enzyme family protein [Bacillus sp. FJAT-29814]|uniref:class I adenylate-forming enzyme family protein n=1 Tax=Bacillus sp. FJAT-29814 TaxID=1729688 RepID=UPI000AA4A5AE|nr:long-chain fatty acid--CoA ligase [Bacillus sp. FJAT-29814]
MMEYQRAKQLLADEMLNRSARRFPQKTALVHNNTRMTYGMLQSRVDNIAGWFQSRGIFKGDKVGVLLYNSIEFIEVLFALARIGAVIVPVNFRLQKSEVEYILGNSDVKMLVAHDDFTYVIKEIRSKLPKLSGVVIVNPSDALKEDGFLFYDSMFKSTLKPKLEYLDDDDDLLIVYTSGTTGRPKGAVLTHKNAFMNAVNMTLECGLTKDEVQLITTPLFHVGGISAMTMIVLVGGTSIIHSKFDPNAILETFDAEKVSYAFMVPSMWNLLLQVPNFQEYHVGSIRVICTAAATTPLELKKKLMEHFPNASVYDTFGHTETFSTSTLKAGDSLIKSGSVGLPFSNIEVRVVDEDMNDCCPGEVGEIIYRGPTVMKEYYNNSAATEEAFKGGWFHSGDLVTYDEDGYLTVVDRKKDMIISGGENIYPKEIEEVLYTHPDIFEAAVVGVPDEKWGETVKAYIVPKPGKKLSEQDIIHYCAERIASYKKPRYVEFLEELPRNASGKILKTKLRSYADNFEKL